MMAKTNKTMKITKVRKNWNGKIYKTILKWMKAKRKIRQNMKVNGNERQMNED